MAGIVVIGGASGLGGEIAAAFARNGEGVVLADAAAPPLQGVSLVLLDLATPDAGAVLMDAAAAHLGRIDTVVVAASAMESAPVDQWTAEMWDRAAAINLRLPFLAVQAALPWLRKSDSASVTMVSSTATLRGQPLTHAYQATKAGLSGLVRSLAAELGPQGIRVNAVLAGWLDTPLTQAYWAGRKDAGAERAHVDARIPLRRHGNAQEAVALIRFLALPAASYITGAMLPVDGGETAV